MRIRTIKPEFWANEKMSAMPDFTRLLAIGLLNYSDDEGYFWANPLLIRGALFPFDEDSTKVRRSLAQLDSEGYVRLGNTSDGRECGQVVNFSKHQRVDKPKPSEIKRVIVFQDTSTTPLGLILDESSLEGKGREGKGSERNGSERGARAQQEPPERGALDREEDRTLPETLNTGPFRAAWAKWVQHWSATFGRGTPIPLATADSHLVLCAKLGSVAAVGAIENAIARGLREPCQPFGNNTPNAKHSTGTSRGFERQQDYSGVTEKL